MLTTDADTNHWLTVIVNLQITKLLEYPLETKRSVVTNKFTNATVGYVILYVSDEKEEELSISSAECKSDLSV